MEITASSGSQIKDFTIDLNLVDPCPTATISLNSSPFTDTTYILRDLGQSQPWVDSAIYSVDTLFDCGPITVDFFNDNPGKTDLDADLFDQNIDPAFLVKSTQDVTKKGVYPILYEVSFTDYPGTKA